MLQDESKASGGRPGGQGAYNIRSDREGLRVPPPSLPSKWEERVSG